MMNNTLLGIISEGSWLVLLLGGIIIGYLLLKFQILFKDVDFLKQDVSSLKQDVGFLKQDVSFLKQDVSSLKQDVGFLKQRFEYFERDFWDELKSILKPPSDDPSPVANKKSPLDLSELGESISESIKADIIADKYTQAYKDAYPEWKNMNAYTTQESCAKFSAVKLKNLLRYHEKEMLEEEAFKRGLNLVYIFQVIALVMRNKILRERGIDIEKVDKHSSSKDNSQN